MVFADSSGIIAAFDGRDGQHRRTAAAWRQLAKTREPLLTTDLVLAETVTHIRRRGGWEPARKVGEAILRSRVIELVCADRERLDAAWREFLRNGTPRLSLCDALSFVVMRERGVTRAFTLDEDFAAAGFFVVP